MIELMVGINPIFGSADPVIQAEALMK